MVGRGPWVLYIFPYENSNKMPFELGSWAGSACKESGLIRSWSVLGALSSLAAPEKVTKILLDNITRVRLWYYG